MIDNHAVVSADKHQDSPVCSKILNDSLTLMQAYFLNGVQHGPEFVIAQKEYLKKNDLTSDDNMNALQKCTQIKGLITLPQTGGCYHCWKLSFQNRHSSTAVVFYWQGR